MVLLRMVLFIFVIEVIFYLLLSIYFRSTKRESLEEEWDRRHPDRAGDSRERSAFVRRSMVGFQKSLKIRLLGLIFVLPTIVVMVIVWFVNVQ